MKQNLLPTLLLGLLAAIAAPRADAGIDVDFRLELGWRAEYHHDFDAAVVLYEYSDYRGRRLVLYPGENLEDFYDYEWGFRVRSVEVIGPVHIVLFDESGLWGHQLTVHHSIADLGDYQMRLNDYSTFRWHRRARSAFVSFNASDFRVSVNIGPRIFPRIYCATRIIPHYYDPWHYQGYHYPRPRWNYDRYRRHVPVPPPNPRIYRPDRSGPGVSPPARHTTRPTTPPPNMGRPPSTRPPTAPPGRPGSIGTPPGSPPPSAPPGRSGSINRPSGQPPKAPPARVENRSPSQTNPPSRTPPSRAQSSRQNPGKPPATQPPRNNTSQPRSAPPSTQAPQNNSSSRTEATSTTRTRSQNSIPQRATPSPQRSAPPRAAPPSRPSSPPRSSPPRSSPPPRRT